MRWGIIPVAMFVLPVLSISLPAPAVGMPVLKESFASPVAASQLQYSKQYNLLFLRHSGSDIHIVDATTHLQIDVRSANQQFTDMDLTPDGQYLYAADWGHVSVGYGTLINPHYVQRYNLATRTWETRQSLVDAYKIEAIDANRVVLLESDQWVDMNLEQWSTSPTLTTLSHAAADFYGDIEYDPANGRIYHGNSGLSSNQIHVVQLTGSTLVPKGGTAMYGSAQNGGGTSVLSLDGTRFYYGSLQVEALDVTHNIRTFPQAIYAATSDLAFGSSAVYNANTGASLGTFGYTTNVYGLGREGGDLWTYYNNTLYHYSVPEPATVGVLGASLVFLIGRRPRCRR